MTYTDSHKAYYIKRKTEGAKGYYLLDDEDFIKLLKEAVKRLKEEKTSDNKPLTNYIKNHGWFDV